MPTSRRRNRALLLVLAAAIVLAVLAVLWGAGLLGDLGTPFFRVDQARPS